MGSLLGFPGSGEAYRAGARVMEFDEFVDVFVATNFVRVTPSASTFARDNGAGCSLPAPQSASVLVREVWSGRSDWPIGRRLSA